MVFSVNDYIFADFNNLPDSQVVLILGAKVKDDGQLSDILMDRALKALELYEEGKVEKILISGDHGTDGYDEVNAVKDFLLGKGVDGDDLFLDHAGFDTYDSVYRASSVFDVDSLIIVTQEFHLSRAVYIARANNLKAYGYIADRQPYFAIQYYRFRELAARAKSFVDVLFNAQPKYLGNVISIEGSGKLTWD